MPVNVAAREIAARRLSPVDLVDALLDRIEALEPKLHAFADVYAADARLAAEAADKAIRSGHAVGPLHGIPVALKDLVELEGRITMGGSAVHRGRRSAVTATIARRMIAQGMIVLGKTHTVEFAFGGWGTNQHLGTPWNPWDLATPRTPGGSSSGSGVWVGGPLAALGNRDRFGRIGAPAGFVLRLDRTESHGRSHQHLWHRPAQQHVRHPRTHGAQRRGCRVALQRAARPRSAGLADSRGSGGGSHADSEQGRARPEARAHARGRAGGRLERNAFGLRRLPGGSRRARRGDHGDPLALSLRRLRQRLGNRAGRGVFL